FLEREGFREVHQLDGGILKYFEDCGDDHYSGECFVFDQRVTVDATLRETATAQCFACQAPVTVEDQRSPRYAVGEYCPRCYAQPEESMESLLAERRQALRRLVTPLPGSEPYENRRPVKVPQRYDGYPALDFLDQLLPHKGRDFWRRAIEAGQMTRGGAPVQVETAVRAGERLDHVLPGTVEPDVDPGIRFLYEDSAILVVDKPAPLPMHPGGRFNRNTLSGLLEGVLAPLVPRAAHRLDANTTGVVVLSKSRRFAAVVQPQFERGEVEKIYLARVHGHPEADRFESTARISKKPVDGGGRAIDPAAGHSAHTRFEVIGRHPDGTATLAVRPLTGRTHQIRLHLWHLGLPICGDAVYRASGELGRTQTRAVGDPPLCLHHRRIAFTHPKTRERVSFEAAAPPWAT
ncbi:MAG: pseudouridine synthase, partial [Acidobacteriota bacterium]